MSLLVDSLLTSVVRIQSAFSPTLYLGGDNERVITKLIIMMSVGYGRIVITDFCKTIKESVEVSESYDFGVL